MTITHRFATFSLEFVQHEELEDRFRVFVLRDGQDSFSGTVRSGQIQPIVQALEAFEVVRNQPEATLLISSIIHS